MANQVTRTQVERWLVAHGFTLKPGTKTSHRQFASRAVTITLPGHGPPDLTKKHLGMILRSLRRAGFSETDLQTLRARGVGS